MGETRTGKRNFLGPCPRGPLGADDACADHDIRAGSMIIYRPQLPGARLYRTLPSSPGILALFSEGDRAEALCQCNASERGEKQVTNGRSGLPCAIDNVSHRLKRSI